MRDIKLRSSLSKNIYLAHVALREMKVVVKCYYLGLCSTGNQWPR